MYIIKNGNKVYFDPSEKLGEGDGGNTKPPIVQKCNNIPSKTCLLLGVLAVLVAVYFIHCISNRKKK